MLIWCFIWCYGQLKIVWYQYNVISPGYIVICVHTRFVVNLCLLRDYWFRKKWIWKPHYVRVIRRGMPMSNLCLQLTGLISLSSKFRVTVVSLPIQTRLDVIESRLIILDANCFQKCICHFVCASPKKLFLPLWHFAANVSLFGQSH